MTAIKMDRDFTYKVNSVIERTLHAGKVYGDEDKKVVDLVLKHEAGHLFESVASDDKDDDNDLGDMTKAELVDVAKGKDIEVPPNATKAEIVKLIEAADEDA